MTARTQRLPELSNLGLFALPAALVAALALIPFLRHGVSGPLITQLFVLLLLLLGTIDLITLKVPNRLVYPSIVFVLLATGLFDRSLLDDALIGGAACLGIMFVIALIGRGAMGMGDVKFGCLIGCGLGLRIGVLALASGFAIGAIISVVILALRLRGIKESVPLTPFLAAGALVWTVLAGTVVS